MSLSEIAFTLFLAGLASFLSGYALGHHVGRERAIASPSYGEVASFNWRKEHCHLNRSAHQ